MRFGGEDLMCIAVEHNTAPFKDIDGARALFIHDLYN